MTSDDEEDSEDSDGGGSDDDGSLSPAIKTPRRDPMAVAPPIQSNPLSLFQNNNSKPLMPPVASGPAAQTSLETP